MADVFISYAREDREFARRLVGALKGLGRESWIDLEGIEPSDRWWQSVTEAIDGADAVVFIASPDSLASETCRRELGHAAERHKRLVPVVCRDVEGLEAPEEIAELNWIFLREEDDWTEGTNRLERALELDIELVRVHTRVLTRAEAWRLSGRRSSPLLRGDELRAAEQWLARAAAGGEPQPTQLQSEFIVASRHSTARRQRRIIAGSLGVAAIAIGLSIFAFIQRAQARHEAKLADSRQLAASAEAELTTSPENAIALAARGLRIAPTLQAEHALWVALQTSRLRGEFEGSSPVDSVAFSPDGRDLAVGSDDGRVRVWGTADHRVLWTAAGTGAAHEIAFASQGDALVVARTSTSFHGVNVSFSCSIEILNAATGALERALVRFSDTCFFAFVGHTRTIEIGTGSGFVQPWNIDNGRPIAAAQQVLPATDIPNALAVSPNGSETALMSLHQVNVLRTSTLSPVTTIAPSQFPFNPTSMAFSPDGTQLMIAGEYETLIYPATGGPPTQLYAQAGSTRGAAWSPDGRILAAAAGFVGVDVWSSAARLVEVLHGSSSQGFSAVAFSSTALLATGSDDGTVRVWAPNPDLPDESRPFPASFQLTQGYEASGAHLAVLGDARYGVLVTGDTGRRIAELSPHGDGPIAVASSGDLAFTRTGHLYVWRLPGGQTVRSWRLPTSTPPAAIAISADGSSAATVASNGVVTVLSRRGNLTAKLAPLPVDVTPILSMSPDGSLLAVTTQSGVVILNTSSLRVADRQPGVAAGFSPSGRLIAIQRPNLSIAILDTSNWHPRLTIGGEPSAVDQLSFSPDDRLLAAVGSSDGTLQVWDTSDGTQIASRQVIESSLEAQRTLPPPAVLTAAGDALVPTFQYPGLSVYDICRECFDPAALLRQANARLGEIRTVSAPG